MDITVFIISNIFIIASLIVFYAGYKKIPSSFYQKAVVKRFKGLVLFIYVLFATFFVTYWLYSIVTLIGDAIGLIF